jgi:TonB-dependent SusC/RagA subfamily outer membrane receptor
MALKLNLTFLLLATLASCSNKPNMSNEKKKFEISDGYSVQNGENFTGSASEVKEIGSNVSLDVYLRKVPGVSVKGDGANAEIRIRGVSSLNAGQEPLFILNGTSFSGGFNALFQTIQTNDIKTVSVLKDASSTGIYGSRGANGVIVITLKKTY